MREPLRTVQYLYCRKATPSVRKGQGGAWQGRDGVRFQTLRPPGIFRSRAHKRGTLWRRIRSRLREEVKSILDPTTIQRTQWYTRKPHSLVLLRAPPITFLSMVFQRSIWHAPTCTGVHTSRADESINLSIVPARGQTPLDSRQPRYSSQAKPSLYTAADVSTGWRKIDPATSLCHHGHTIVRTL